MIRAGPSLGRSAGQVAYLPIYGTKDLERPPSYFAKGLVSASLNAVISLSVDRVGVGSGARKGRLSWSRSA
jgi:hypothetical protein